MCCDSPDTSGMNAAALKSSQISQEALDWFKAEAARTQTQRDEVSASAQDVSKAQVGGMEFATDEAKRLSNRTQTVFEPLEDKLVTQAQEYDTPQRRDAAAEAAMAGVDSSFGKTVAATQRALARSGIAPGGGTSQAMMLDVAGEQAKARAGAGTVAGRNVEAQGYARMADAAALGRGLPSTQATQQQIASTTGNSSVASGQGALTAQAGGAALMGQGFSTGLQGQSVAGNLYGKAADIENQANAGLGGMMSGIGGIGAMFGKGGVFAMSDKNVKSGVKKTDTKKALDQVNKTAVNDWSYDPAKGGPNDGGMQHTGPMAQTVKKNMGGKAAPGGKVVDLVTMNGKLMAGMQELTKRVKKLEGAAA